MHPERVYIINQNGEESLKIRGLLPKLKCYSCNFYIKKGTGILKSFQGLYYYVCQACDKKTWNATSYSTDSFVDDCRKQLKLSNQFWIMLLAISILSIIKSVSEIYGW